MLIENDIKKILNQLANGKQIKVPFDGSDITIRVIDESSKLVLTTLVYDGQNYIPSSVRRCLSHKFSFSHMSISTFLTIDEQNFQIRLNYLGHATEVDHENFKELLEEFGIIAEMWRLYLDEHDKHDLVYVRRR